MITVGEHSYVGGKIDCYEEVQLAIGKFCSIGSGLKIYSGAHPIIEHPKAVSQYPFAEVWKINYPPCKMGGKVTIHHDVWIATDVSILEGVTIGSGSVIGAGAVVTKSVPPYSFVAGNPGVVKYQRYTKEIREKLMRIKWWNWPDEKIRACIEEFQDINLFVETYA